MQRFFLVFFFVATVVRPSSSHAEGKLEGAEQRAQAVIRRAIEAHGHDALIRASVRFSFRGTPYSMRRDNGQFVYERWTTRGTSKSHETLTNQGYTATINGQRISLPPRVQDSRRKSLNSVVYFASLPLVLRDPAVRATALSPTRIKGERYDTIQVQFSENGGGDDHDDVFLYWFEQKTGRLAYLAYRFHTGQGGVRFRVATGFTKSGQVTFVQWDNYGLEDKTVSLAS
ncbi:MAG: DUF6503 family protein, partial [Myxococcota bacterium]